MKKTQSICPVCLKKISAELTETDGKILIRKECEEHGTFSISHWQSQRIFDLAEKNDFFKYFEDSSRNSDQCPYSCGTCEKHVSSTVIGVIDVTKRCDLKCAVCFSVFSENEVDYEPSKEEIIKILEFLSHRNPKPPAILFSGGEPLLRADIHEIIGVAHKLRFMTVLATNGLRIAKSPDIAARLKKNGLNIVYLQFDGFQDEFYQKIRGKKLLADKLKTIKICRKNDLEIILVTTLIRGLNDKEIGQLIRFAAQNSDVIRGLIFQPIAFTGRASGNPMNGEWVDGRFAEEVETQTQGEISATDLFPLPVMIPPIKIMSQFMNKPWPIFSCSPQCGIVNWVFVSKNSQIIPINHFINFDKFFKNLLRTAKNVEKKGRLTILLSLFLASILALNWPKVGKEIGILTLMKTILRMHISPSYKSIGNLRRRIFLLGCMAFMDQYNFDLDRVKRCVIHYATPDLKIIPFCAYNNVHRIQTEKEYALKHIAK